MQSKLPCNYLTTVKAPNSLSRKMCLLTITPEYRTKSTTSPNRVITKPKATPPEPSQPTPHHITCNANTKDKDNDNGNAPTSQPTKETGRVTENELLHLLLASQREKSQNQNPPQSQSQSQSQQRTPAPPPPPRPREEHHYHHYAAPVPAPPLRKLGRRRSSASSSAVSVRSFESVRRKVGGLFQRVGALERDRERKEWLAEAATAAKVAGTGRGRRERSRSRSRSRSPRLRLVGVGGMERFPDFHGRGRPVRECRREERLRQW